MGFASVAWALVLPLYAYKVWRKQDYTDFGVYYRAAARMRDGLWSDLYSMGDGASPFRYAPLTLPLWRPFAALSYAGAKMAWFALQSIWFGAAFYLIYRVLKFSRVRHPATIAVLSSLFVLRFCLDCFTIGQVSSLLFLGLAASFAAWSFRRGGLAATALSIPAVFKIGPGILFPLFLKGRPRDRWRAILTPMALLAAWNLGLAAWLRAVAPSHGAALFTDLWAGWLNAVARDADYFDASHYGSQSVKSFLLRAAGAGWLAAGNAHLLYLLAALMICGGTVWFWSWRKPRGVRGRAFFFATGLFPYLWVMPETFKYTLTTLALPVALLIAELSEPRAETARDRRFTIFALAFGTLTLSLAGKDLLPDAIFFGLQRASVPLLATFFLGFATYRYAWRNSLPSRLAKTAGHLLGDHRAEPWAAGVQPRIEREATLIAPIPLQAGQALNSALIGSLLLDAEKLLGPGAEIRLIPFGDRVSAEHPDWRGLAELALQRGWSIPAPAEIEWTRSLALRAGFQAARGKKILVFQADQPCDPIFYADALARMRAEGWALVRGNRRHAQSRFRIPVRLLRLVYRRHQLGLQFNRLVRAMLPVQTTDTHSGMLVLDRQLAQEAFALQSSKDFLFDLELSLVARAQGFRETELPVALHLAVEKTPSRMAWETLSILLGLPRLAWRHRRGYYRRVPRISRHVTSDDWGISPEVNRGILELAQLGVIRRVSVMARARYIKEGLTELRAIPGVQLGLHFDLTFEKARPRDIFFRWLNPRADRAALAREATAELDRQLMTLAAAGIKPDYLDGHHHIHVVPGILNAIAARLHAAGITDVRLPYDPTLWATRYFALNLLALAVRGSLRKNGFRYLPFFYPQAAHFRDAGLFRASLARFPEHEVIVHPARANDFDACGIVDPYNSQRVTEFRALRMLGEGAPRP